MAYRRRIFNNRPILLLQCIVCRHYVVADKKNKEI